MSSDVYRFAASIMVLKPVEVCGRDQCGIVYQVLLLHKPRKKDAWQLPQGGVESGESVEQAALRELKEEAGIGHCDIVGKSPIVYKYDFPPSFRRFRPDNVCGQRIEYIFATVERDTNVQVDDKEIDAYAWVDPAQFHLYLKRREYVTIVNNLYAEALKALATSPAANAS